MTSTERQIADRLALAEVAYARDKIFIEQLKNWNDREMTGPGKAKMMRMFERYQRFIPDYHQLRSAYINEQMNNLAP